MQFTKKYDVKKTECYVMKQCIYFKEKLLFFKKMLSAATDLSGS